MSPGILPFQTGRASRPTHRLIDTDDDLDAATLNLYDIHYHLDKGHLMLPRSLLLLGLLYRSVC